MRCDCCVRLAETGSSAELLKTVVLRHRNLRIWNLKRSEAPNRRWSTTSPSVSCPPEARSRTPSRPPRLSRVPYPAAPAPPPPPPRPRQIALGWARPSGRRRRAESRRSGPPWTTQSPSSAIRFVSHLASRKLGTVPRRISCSCKVADLEVLVLWFLWALLQISRSDLADTEEVVLRLPPFP